ncbi:MAG TPA: AGE family epimerase/isomerase [Rhodobacteraceae bacterium]|nr:AGE family epimerase/isomerase [Paracoccaceae bacterium]
MNKLLAPGSESATGFWLDDSGHHAWLKENAEQQFAFFSASLRNGHGFHVLDENGRPLPDNTQELITTTRLVHSYALAKQVGYADADRIIDQGMAYLKSHHHDPVHGGYVWSLDGDTIVEGQKLAYGHAFVLLAASSAKMAGHPGADALLADVSEVLDQHFWEESAGLFADEWNRDWSPFSTYRGMNANMHGLEALLTAFEATKQSVYLQRAGRILSFFTGKIAPAEGWRLPEHFTKAWVPDRAYAGDPMFRPAGTTPGHSFEMGRLLLQYWDLCERPESDAPKRARQLIETALADAWREDGGFVYTLGLEGRVGVSTRYWWPVTEAIGALASLIKLDRRAADEIWYRRLWHFANSHFIDHERGGWFPEIDESGAATHTIFKGKPDIYHAVQACIFPQAKGLSNQIQELSAVALR